ncbi:hypothetical protein ATZ33_09295 [Enterococcus silesiacus]|uniref:Shikimate kinase n=1 Tax=Enterococcus silesiacus TaxID=332949 RepID=A0A0S3KBF0_9ENTE|nr:AAA family ATPase [Enterococcus silesiacus]ALS01557.1 hypothetical protein ATZ33_09295 [Enterococcus silesiacus]OJG91990.1 hypothetical protein RV15_GL003635 [Enterococcus silesiacus]
MKLQLIGASGTGKSTLGNYIAEKKHIKWIDTDDYLWKDKTFSENYPIEQRLKLYHDDREKFDHFVVSGSVFSWNPTGFTDRDLLVFLTIDDEQRFQRLIKREITRAGATSVWLDPQGNQTNDFLDWCKTYYTAKDPSDIGTFAEHSYQIAHSKSPVLKLDSSQPLDISYQLIKQKLEKNPL